MERAFSRFFRNSSLNLCETWAVSDIYLHPVKWNVRYWILHLNSCREHVNHSRPISYQPKHSTRAYFPTDLSTTRYKGSTPLSIFPRYLLNHKRRWIRTQTDVQGTHRKPCHFISSKLLNCLRRRRGLLGQHPMWLFEHVYIEHVYKVYLTRPSKLLTFREHTNVPWTTMGNTWRRNSQ